MVWAECMVVMQCAIMYMGVECAVDFGLVARLRSNDVPCMEGAADLRLVARLRASDVPCMEGAAVGATATAI